MSRSIYIVDEQGATFWFFDRDEAEEMLVREAWNGAVHLTISEATLPAGILDNEAITEWAINQARDPGCDQ